MSDGTVVRDVGRFAITAKSISNKRKDELSVRLSAGLLARLLPKSTKHGISRKI